jgi:Domain of unknown function (DUF1816)
MKEFFISMLEKLGMAFWIEIVTEVPRCTYYFGPFLNRTEAESMKIGYLDDLNSEGAVGITVMISQCYTPDHLTVEFGEHEAGQISQKQLASLTRQSV